MQMGHPHTGGFNAMYTKADNWGVTRYWRYAAIDDVTIPFQPIYVIVSVMYVFETSRLSA